MATSKKKASAKRKPAKRSTSKKTSSAKRSTSKKTSTSKRRRNPDGGWHCVVEDGAAAGCFTTRSAAETRCREIRHRGRTCRIVRTPAYVRRGANVS